MAKSRACASAAFLACNSSLTVISSSLVDCSSSLAVSSSSLRLCSSSLAESASSVVFWLSSLDDWCSSIAERNRSFASASCCFSRGDLAVPDIAFGRRVRRFGLAPGGARHGFEKDQDRPLLTGVQRHRLHVQTAGCFRHARKVRAPAAPARRSSAPAGSASRLQGTIQCRESAS